MFSCLCLCGYQLTTVVTCRGYVMVAVASGAFDMARYKEGRSVVYQLTTVGCLSVKY